MDIINGMYTESMRDKRKAQGAKGRQERGEVLIGGKRGREADIKRGVENDISLPN